MGDAGGACWRRRAQFDRRAGKIDEPQARRMFREKIPEHVETVALVPEWVAPSNQGDG